MAGVPVLVPALFAANGTSPASGAKLYSYIKGTSTLQTFYTDEAATIPAANPTIANSLGATVRYLDPAKAYDLVAKTSDDATTLFSVTFNVDANNLTLGAGQSEALSDAITWADIASATTTELDSVTNSNLRVTGTTTITSLGTATSGLSKTVRFAAALTLTYNATSLILPGAANITTAANDTAEFVSLGSGNWICTNYNRAIGSQPLTADSTLTYVANVISGGSLAPTARSNAARVNSGLVIDAMEYGLVLGGSTSQHTLINNIMADLHARGGGVLQLPPTGSSYICIKGTIDNYYNNVLVRGAGRGHWGVQSGTGPVAGTKLLCNEGATTGVTALKHRSTSGASRGSLQGGGFENLDVWGAGIALQVTSRWFGIYDIHVEGYTGSPTESVLFDCLRSYNSAGLGSTVGDNQHAIIRLSFNLSGSVNGVKFSCDSTTPATANTSLITGIIVVGVVGTGYLIDFDCSDSLIFEFVRAFSGSTGKPFIARPGVTATGKFNMNNRICFLSATNAGVIQGTDVGNTATYMDIDWLDTGNATPVPTLGTGARYSARYGTHGTFQGLNSVALALGVTSGDAVTSRSEIETAAGIYNIWITNENASGLYVLVCQTATHRWGLGQDNSANFVFDKLAGSGGFVEVPKLRVAGIPTSASGLTSGEVWSDAGTLKIVS